MADRNLFNRRVFDRYSVGVIDLSETGDGYLEITVDEQPSGIAAAVVTLQLSRRKVRELRLALGHVEKLLPEEMT
jgi:hypothetical protein